MRVRLTGYIVVLVLLGGCLGRGPYTPPRYYSVDTLPATAPQAARSWPIALGIRPFTAATRYRDRILYRHSEVKVGFYEYDRWVEPPEEMVTRFVSSMVRASGLFRQAISADNIHLPAWLLSGALTRFDEVRGEQQNQAECWLRVELRRARDEQILWSGVIRAAVPLAVKTPEALAQAMSQAVLQVTLRLITELATADLPAP